MLWSVWPETYLKSQVMLFYEYKNLAQYYTPFHSHYYVKLTWQMNYLCTGHQKAHYSDIDPETCLSTVLQTLFYVTASISLLLLNVMHLARHWFETHL